MSLAKKLAEKKLLSQRVFEAEKKEFVSKHLGEVHPRLLEHGENELYDELEPQSLTYEGMMNNYSVYVTVSSRPSNLPVSVISLSPLVSIEITLKDKPKVGKGIYGPGCLYCPCLDRGLREYFKHDEQIDPIHFIKSKKYEIGDGKTKKVKLIQDKEGYFFETDDVVFMYLSLKDPNKISVYLTKRVYQSKDLLGIVDDILNEGLALQDFDKLKLVE